MKRMNGISYSERQLDSILTTFCIWFYSKYHVKNMKVQIDICVSLCHLQKNCNCQSCVLLELWVRLNHKVLQNISPEAFIIGWVVVLEELCCFHVRTSWTQRWNGHTKRYDSIWAVQYKSSLLQFFCSKFFRWSSCFLLWGHVKFLEWDF